MTLAAWAVQSGVYAHLAQDTALRALLGDPARIFDAIPEEAAFPLLTLGASRMRELEGVADALEHDIRLTAYSRWGGRAEVKAIESALHDALHDQAVSIAGYRLVSSRFLFADTFRLADGDTYQSVMRYRLVTQPVV